MNLTTTQPHFGEVIKLAPGSQLNDTKINKELAKAANISLKRQILIDKNYKAYRPLDLLENDTFAKVIRNEKTDEYFLATTGPLEDTVDCLEKHKGKISQFLKQRPQTHKGFINPGKKVIGDYMMTVFLHPKDKNYWEKLKNTEHNFLKVFSRLQKADTNYAKNRLGWLVELNTKWATEAKRKKLAKQATT